MVPMHVSLMRLHLKYCVQFWASCYKQDIGLFESVQRRVSKLVKGLKNKSYGEWLGELCLFSLAKGILRGNLITLYNYLKGACSKEGVHLFSLVISDTLQGNGCKFFQGKFRWEIKKNLFMERFKHWNRLDLSNTRKK